MGSPDRAMTKDELNYFDIVDPLGLLILFDVN